MKYEVNANLEGIDNPQYYSGHGHSFEDNLVSCLQFQVGVFDPTNLEDFISVLDTELNASEWADIDNPIIDNDLSVLKDLCINDYFDKQELINWFEEMKHQYNEYLNRSTEDDLNMFNRDIDLYLYGYIHIYRGD